MKNSDEPAMPFEIVDEVQSSRWWSGMTKREMIAMHAPEAPKWFWRKWAADNGVEYGCIGDGLNNSQAIYFAWRTHYADALLAELERTK